MQWLLCPTLCGLAAVMIRFPRSSFQLRRYWISALAAALCVNARAEGIRNAPPVERYARPPLHINAVPAGPAYYGPAEIRHVYGVDNIPADGTGQTIAIVDAYGSPFLQQDLNLFCWYFGLPWTTVAVYYPQGQTGFDVDWAGETALDVEWAHTIAPGARLVLVVAQTESLKDLLGAVDYAVDVVGADVVSMSWGLPEFSGEVVLDSHFQKAGVTFVTSSGDSGEDVQWPAASPYVLSVGGTSLYLDGNGNYSSEIGWDGSGGGVSAYEDLPFYQTGWLAANGRGVPDVSYVADPNTGVEVVFGDFLYIFGGTSVGAPQWAGLIALSKSLSRSRGVDSVNQAVYAVASLHNSFTIDSTYFYDITSGSNGPDPDDFATTGYDLVSGLGSPVGQNLVLALTTLGPVPLTRLLNVKKALSGY
jgi:subtilase family serine protease